MTVELEEIRKSRIYTVKSSIKNVLDDLQKIAELDSFAEIQQKRYGKIALFCFLGIVALFVILFVISLLLTNTELLGVILLLSILIAFFLIIYGIYTLFMYFKFQRLNLQNYRYDLTKKVIQMLYRDIKEDALIDLGLSFKSLDKVENKTGTIDHPYKAGWKIDSYTQSWLTIKGQFIDKTYFELSLTEILKKQYGWKRGSSGKSKYKSKSKSGGLDISISLTYPKKRYGAIKLLQQEVNHAIKLPISSSLRRLRITDEAIYITARVAPQFVNAQDKVYQTITAMFLSSYQVLNLAKMLTK
ncbi:hypothetical protein CLI64_01185 [Nostoc sp. CENA543]|uniref:hypothetical protein n=1 Tax=Nostoc sp. CENA543 TaxID=1869241 RepID=UPI000CA0985D|nr:hypothetical protein [Nostoc sp. CENA543]AUS99121.1 hypothetical protein CLI64_01185 [Nostoc sp. CENA543]